MTRLRQRITPAMMVLAGLCAVAAVSTSVPATAATHAAGGAAQAHARAAIDAPMAHARASLELS
jgi:hypothetical protein